MVRAHGRRGGGATTDTHLDVEDDSSVVVSDAPRINFRDNIGAIAFPAVGDAPAVDAIDTRTDVSDNGGVVVSDTEDINFGADLTVTDDGDSSVTVDSTASGGGGTTSTPLGYTLDASTYDIVIQGEIDTRDGTLDEPHDSELDARGSNIAII